MILPKIINFLTGSTVLVQQEDGGSWIYGTVVGRGNHNHNNRSFTIRVTKTGFNTTGNSKHIKMTPITAEQYLRDQLTWYREDLLDKTSKQYETLSPYRVPNNDKDRRRKETDMNSHSDMQTSSTQGHALTDILNNWEHIGIIRKHQQRDI